MLKKMSKGLNCEHDRSSLRARLQLGWKDQLCAGHWLMLFPIAYDAIPASVRSLSMKTAIKSLRCSLATDETQTNVSA